MESNALKRGTEAIGDLPLRRETLSRLLHALAGAEGVALWTAVRTDPALGLQFWKWIGASGGGCAVAVGGEDGWLESSPRELLRQLSGEAMAQWVVAACAGAEALSGEVRSASRGGNGTTGSRFTPDGPLACAPGIRRGSGNVRLGGARERAYETVSDFSVRAARLAVSLGRQLAGGRRQAAASRAYGRLAEP
ncbi:MAG: hypothetical protein HY000_05420, partial [Planctomycetes bacterium]|nr:hypothetical protein [Planctomycetota bacterium]